MSAQEMRVSVIANNLANIQTSGFKRSQVDFQDLVYMQVKPAGTESTPTGLEIGNGVRTSSTTKVFTQGEMESTKRPLDLAIEGDGFFKVKTRNGPDRYTRDGSFRTDANGDLVTAGGYLLDPPIQIPPDWKEISISSDGKVSVVAGEDDAPQEVGTIQLVRFANPSGLISCGENLYAESPASGTPTEGEPGTSGLGSVRQGFLERSNVEMVTDLVNLISAQRAYEINARAIKAGDQMLSTANNLLQ
jgi:flagellar basal-body rod protein FlgG